MYNAMLAGHAMANSVGQHTIGSTEIHSRSNRTILSQYYSFNGFEQYCPIEYLQLMGVDMSPTHSGIYGNHSQGYRNENSWRDRPLIHGTSVAHPQIRNGYRQTNGHTVTKSYWNKSIQRSQRSTTPVTRPSSDQSFNDDSSDDLSKCSSDSSKGVKRLHNMYSHPTHCLSEPQHFGHQLNHSQGQSYHHHSMNFQTGQQQGKRKYNYNSRSHAHRQTRGRRVCLQISSHLHHPLLPAPDYFLKNSKSVEVRATPIQLLKGGEWDMLSLGIWTKFIKNQQKQETFRKKMKLWKDLFHYLFEICPRYGLYLVGSTMSGFGSDSSDVDMCLLVNPTEIDQRNEAIRHLDDVRLHLRFCRHIQQLELIQAKVPILKFRDIRFDLEVDLNCNNAVGIRNTHLLHCYSQLDWRVRPLVLIVKLWAHKHNINNAKNMTISSYSLVLMVIHFLQCGVSPPVLPCLHGMYDGKFTPHSNILAINIHEDMSTCPFNSNNSQTIGELLFEFLRYYVEFDYNEYAISVRMASKLPVDECRRAPSLKNDPHQWKYLCVEEPFDLTNTAHSVYDKTVFEKVKSIFQSSFNKLKKKKDIESIFNLD